MNSIKMLAWLTCVVILFSALAIAGCAKDDDDDNNDDVADDDNDAGDDDSATPDDDDLDDDTGSPVLDHPVDETVNLPGLSSEARVALDQYAIPYIFAANEHDMAMVLGYMEAKQRFFQIDFLRHTFEGRLTEYLWSLPLDSDLYYRVIFMSPDGRLVVDRIAESLNEETRDLVQAYSDGINAWLAEKRQENPLTDWPKEYDFFFLKPADVPDWEIRDTVAIARYQTWDLSNTLDYEMSLTYYAEGMDADLFDQIFTRAMATSTTVLPPGKLSALSAPGGYHSALPAGYLGLSRALQFVQKAKRFAKLSPDGKASNNWVVSPDINNGVGYLANDPHLSLTYPSIFMLGYLDDKELGDGQTRNWGSIFPGTPAVVIGANEKLAWGETVAGYDVLDVYAEQLVLQGGLPKKVVFNGNNVNLIESIQEFKIRGSASPEKISVYVVPHHGPILPDSLDGNTALSFRWTGQEPTYELYTFLQLREATNVDQGFDAISNFEVGAQNFVLQDTAGDIGYFPYAKVPVRNWNFAENKPWLVVPGDGSAEWDGYIPPEEMPQAINPDRGFLLSANNDINGTALDGDPTSGEYYWYFGTDIGYRAQRIDDLLSGLAESKGFSMEAMEQTQWDVHANYYEDLMPMVEDALGGDLSGLSAPAKSMLDFWQNWGFEMDSGLAGTNPEGAASSDETARNNAVAAMTFAHFEIRLRELAFGDEITIAGLDYPVGWDEQKVALVNLEANDPLWDNAYTDFTETRRMIINDALNATAEELAGFDEFNGLPVAEWYWGHIHNLLLGHIAFSSLGFHFGDLGPFAIPGGMHTVNVAGFPEDGVDYTVTNGPSLRIIHEFADGQLQKTHVHYPGGQIPKFTDPHQQDILALYLSGEYYEMPHQVAPILEATEYMMAFTGQ